MTGRQSVVLGAAVLALTLVVTTGGYSAAAADRSVDVRVVDDDRAFVGVQACERPARPDSGGNGSTGTGDGNPVRVRVTNRLSDPLDGASVTGYAGGVRVPRTDRRRAFTRAIRSGDSTARTLTFRDPVDELRVRTGTADGSVSVSVTVDVAPRSAPGCPLGG